MTKSLCEVCAVSVQDVRACRYPFNDQLYDMRQ